MPTLISGSTGVNKITDGTIVDADVASGSTMTSHVPTFRAALAANQDVNQGTTRTKIACASETFDTDNWYDTSAYRYTPQKAGYYQFHGQVSGGTGTMRAMYLDFKKNGSNYSGTNLYADNNSWDDITNELGSNRNVTSLLTVGSTLFAGTLSDGVYLSTNNGNNSPGYPFFTLNSL